MKRKIMMCGLLGILLATMSCSSKGLNSFGTSDSSLPTNTEISNTSPNSNNIDIEIDIILRQDFYYNESHYIMKIGKKVIKDESNTFIGYFINEEDIDKWTLYDNDSTLIYVIDDGNGLLRKSSGKEELINRFELYSFENSDKIGVLENLTELVVYEKEV